MARRSPETLVDWLVVGIAPFLIMMLVGSLVFYLVEVFYLGDYQARLLFVMAMFVMAIVCIARISMEEGAAYATLYAIPLAAVVALALGTFVEVRGPLAALGPTLNWLLMAIVWWSAHKLTWDCTLIEGGRDFTGQGLMQTTGLDRFLAPRDPRVGQVVEPEATKPVEPDLSGTTTAAASPAKDHLPIWKWWEYNNQRPHAPGVWVVYYSIASLPLFGLAQWFVPADNLELRRRTFWLLVIYVAAALSLLLSTSFLSLRRYLRQRKLEMPLEMAGVWLTGGAIMVVAVLILASLLPRPIPEYSITHLAPDIRAPKLDASRWGWGQEGAKAKPDSAQTATKGEPASQTKQSSPDGQGSPQQSPDGKPGGQQGSGKQASGKQGNQAGGQNKGQGGSQNQSGQQGKSGEQKGSGQGSSSGQQNQAGNQKGSQPQNSNHSAEQKSAESKSGESKSGDSKSGDSKSGDSKSGAQPRGNPPNQQQPSNQGQPASSQQAEPPNQQKASEPSEPPRSESPPPPASTRPSISSAIGQFFAYFMHLLKWIFYLLVLAAIVYFAWQHRERLHAAWLQLLKELRDLWERLFGRATTAAAEQAVVAAAPPPKRFADFADPFSSGMAARWTLAQLVRYTFEALEARGRERSCPRQVDQTPLEYAALVGQTEPALAGEFRWLADLYSQLAFAGVQQSPQAAGQLRHLWQRWKQG
jgi:hypothetical protein